MTFAYGPYLVLPYYWNVGDPTKNTKLLDFATENAAGYTTDCTPEERRDAAAATLSNPQNRIFEIWQVRDFIGIFTLEHIVPQVDALFHFYFLDGRFRGRRDLIIRF